MPKLQDRAHRGGRGPWHCGWTRNGAGVAHPAGPGRVRLNLGERSPPSTPPSPIASVGPPSRRLVERRAVDGVVVDGTGISHVLEVDEKQHFNLSAVQSLELYRPTSSSDFQSNRGRSLEAEGPPGRRRIRAAAATAVRHGERPAPTACLSRRACRPPPPVNGWGPTIRIAAFELEPWIWGSDAPAEFGLVLGFGLQRSKGSPGRTYTCHHPTRTAKPTRAR